MLPKKGGSLAVRKRRKGREKENEEYLRFSQTKGGEAGGMICEDCPAFTKVQASTVMLDIMFYICTSDLSTTLTTLFSP